MVVVFVVLEHRQQEEVWEFSCYDSIFLIPNFRQTDYNDNSKSLLNDKTDKNTTDDEHKNDHPHGRRSRKDYT